MQSFSNLRFFCKHIVNKYGSPASASEDEKADEFHNVYLHKLPLNLKTLGVVAVACGIHLNSMDDGKLPQNLREFHDVFGDRRNIYYKKNDTRSGIENTILHEFREMIESVFAELCPDYELLHTIAVHQGRQQVCCGCFAPEKVFQGQSLRNRYGCCGALKVLL